MRQLKACFVEPPGYKGPSSTSFKANLGSLLDDGSCSDVVFSVQGVDVHAHRCILAAQSSVMRALLTNGMCESKGGRKIEITDIEAPVFKELLRYLYTVS